jgi:hypothetical protein
VETVAPSPLGGCLPKCGTRPTGYPAGAAQLITVPRGYSYKAIRDRVVGLLEVPVANAVFAFVVAVGVFSIIYVEKAWGWKAEIPALPMFVTFLLAAIARQVIRLRQGRKKPFGLYNPEDRQ